MPIYENPSFIEPLRKENEQLRKENKRMRKLMMRVVDAFDVCDMDDLCTDESKAILACRKAVKKW